MIRKLRPTLSDGDMRIAIALAKTRAARAFDVDEISQDAIELGRASRAARLALIRGISGKGEKLAKVRQIADRYGAELKVIRNPEKTIVGLRFRDCSYTGPIYNVFRLA